MTLLFYPLLIFPAAAKIRYAMMFTQTTLAPAGVDNKNDAHIPIRKQTTERIPEHITTDLKLPKTRIDESGGKIMSAEISIDPTSRMPMTIVSAERSAISIFDKSVRKPVAFAKFSSNVTEKICE